jgi:hypothetical protein
MDDRDMNPADGIDEDGMAREERRRILKIGAYAAYTAPILLAMATSAKAQALSKSTAPAVP